MNPQEDEPPIKVDGELGLFSHAESVFRIASRGSGTQT